MSLPSVTFHKPTMHIISHHSMGVSVPHLWGYIYIYYYPTSYLQTFSSGTFNKKHHPPKGRSIVVFYSYPYLWEDEQDLPDRKPNPSSFHIQLFPPETAFQSSWPILLRQRPAISPTGETRGAVVVFTSVGGRSFRRRFHMRHSHMRHSHMRHSILLEITVTPLEN